MSAEFTANQIERTKKAFLSSLNGDQLNAENILKCVVSAMSAAGSFIELNGEQKKRLVILCAINAINEAPLSEENKILLKNLIETVAGSAIDLMVSASKGLYQFGKAKGWCCF